MLVSRILRALLAGAQPHEILAITFTRKAAGEMRARLDEWLGELGSPSCDDEKRAQELQARGLNPADAKQLAPVLATLHERLLRTGRSVEVRTFHAWFSQLLRAAPLELLAELGRSPTWTCSKTSKTNRADVYRRFYAAVIADEGCARTIARWFATEAGRSAQVARCRMEQAHRNRTGPTVPAPWKTACLPRRITGCISRTSITRRIT